MAPFGQGDWTIMTRGGAMEVFWLFCEPMFVAFTGMTPARKEQLSIHRPVDHSDMTVLRPREDRGADVAPATAAQAEGFPARLSCLDAQLPEKISKEFHEKFGDF
ncbi:hypothetical protein A2707_00875 [Candidatus Saccharibacteria bacterium RIFCSPHIGHO2_01_FULL_45_15]|nr:MAG: hypothetical protein A2707_00875 [Candidatus Saccharibacteria bacterium RIFCSPHIGHO2_01_FULL_45_15]OGL26925.1 MAG: hypothetical protein A3C39_01990 [Candidatus Saccharibacteria bacterium RIFCSPHIGHO2_02_FULL_46_12]